jgi:hypothetical protein
MCFELSSPSRTEPVSRRAVPDAPPLELSAEVLAASRRVDELRAQGRELHFGYDALGTRLQIQVRELDGTVLAEIPPSAVLDVVAGEPLEA